MLAEVRVNPNMTVTIEAAKQKDLFKLAASAHEVFGEKSCGICGCTNIVPVWRTATTGAGKNVETFEFPEYRCLGFDKKIDAFCRAKLCLGTINDDTGTLFPHRALVESPTGMRPPTKAEKKAGNSGKWGPHRGWHRYVKSEQQAAVVARVQKGIIHLQPGIADGEIERDGLVIPENAAVAEFEAIYGKSEELLDRSLNRKSARPLGKVGGTVGIENDVDHGLVEDNFVKCEFGTEKRADLQACSDGVGVGERNVDSGLAAVDGDVAHLHLQAEGNGMDAADFGAAPGNALNLGDHAAANQGLKGVRVDIDEQGESAEKADSGKKE